MSCEPTPEVNVGVWETGQRLEREHFGQVD
jgi:hypothetical protein